MLRCIKESALTSDGIPIAFRLAAERHKRRTPPKPRMRKVSKESTALPPLNLAEPICAQWLVGGEPEPWLAGFVVRERVA